MARRFKRQESWRLKRVKESWRRPRGGTSRIRLEISGWPRKPNIGFQKDSRIRGLHPSGLIERLVRQERDLEGVDPKKHIVRLAHQLGEKKRLVILEKARQLKVHVANPGTQAVEATPAEEPVEETGMTKAETVDQASVKEQTASEAEMTSEETEK